MGFWSMLTEGISIFHGYTKRALFLHALLLVPDIWKICWSFALNHLEIGKIRRPNIVIQRKILLVIFSLISLFCSPITVVWAYVTCSLQFVLGLCVCTTNYPWQCSYYQFMISTRGMSLLRQTGQSWTAELAKMWLSDLRSQIHLFVGKLRGRKMLVLLQAKELPLRLQAT